MLIEYFNIDITHVKNEFYNFSVLYRSRNFNNNGNVNRELGLSCRKLKRREFAKFQYRFGKNRNLVIKELFEGRNNIGEIDKGGFLDFWKGIMVNDEDSCTSEMSESDVGLTELDVNFWRSITIEEIHNALPDMDKASGPDGVTAQQILYTPHVILCKILKIFICMGNIPRFLVDSKTVFLPKQVNSSDPSQFRPIFMSSLLCRLFHKVLAGRIQNFNN